MPGWIGLIWIVFVSAASGGLGRNWRSSRSQAATTSAKATRRIGAPEWLLAKSEDIERSAPRGLVGQVPHSIDEAQSCAAVTRVETAGDDRAGPAADTRQDCYVLIAVGPAINRWLTYNAGACLEFPKLFPGFRVHCFEPTLHCSIEHDPAGGHRCSAPGREVFIDAPDLLALGDIPGRKLAAVPARSGVHPHVHPDIGRARYIAGLRRFDVLAEIVMRDVEEFGLWRKRGGLPVLRAGRSGAAVSYDLPGYWLCPRVVLQPTGL